jgi:flagellar protein FlgJ
MDAQIQGLLNQSLNTVQASKANNAVNATKQPKNIEEIDAAAKEFESVFISQMLNHMFAGIETDDVFGGGQSEKIYRSMQIQEYGKIITESGGIGVTDAIRAEMIKLQEGR